MTLPTVRAKCLGCQTVALRTEYEPTATRLIVRIRCAICGERRIATLVDEAPTEKAYASPPDPPEVDLVAAARRIFDVEPASGGIVGPAGTVLVGESGAEETIVVGAPPPGRVDAGLAASDASGRAGWTEAELAEVKRAILAVADRLDEFTADDVWTELGPGFPVTKGLAGRLSAAHRAGVIEPTGKVSYSQREGEHGHGQRLGIWHSLRRKAA